MKKQSIAARVAASCGLAAALVGCGGGSSNSSVPAPNAVTIGVQNGIYTAVGQTVTVSWSNSQRAACSGSGALAGALAASGTQAVVPTAEGADTFTVTCGGTVQSATITVLPQYTTIKDAVFEQALVTLGVDDVLDGKVLTASILKVKKLAIYGGAPYQMASDVQAVTTGSAYITDATGLENFRNLTWLRFDNQKVASFDLSRLTGLTWLSLWQEPITTLDLSHNLALETVGLSETSLSAVDLSALSNLTDLEIQEDEAMQGAVYTLANGTVVTGFTSLDVSHNSQLDHILAFGNHLTTLDLSHNFVFTSASLSYNRLTSMTIAGDKKIDSLVVDHNQLTSLDIAGSAIGQIVGPQGLISNGNPGLTSITVTNAAQMTTWCSNAVAATAKNSTDYGVCTVDAGTVFVSGT